MRFHQTWFFLFLSVAFLLLAEYRPAGAQQSTSATFQDWVVQCQIQPGPPPQKLCDMAQVTQIQGKNIPFSRVAIAPPAKGAPVKLTVQVPVNVSFVPAVRVQMSTSDPGITAAFARCLPAGCFADFDLKDDIMQKFRAMDVVGKISFKDANGRDIAIPLSFKGFRQAFEALVKD
jgi:invasion protein IalB